MECPYCSKEAKWTENKVIYGKNYGDSYMCYFCKPCNAYVGCHGNSKSPLGTMANKQLRLWRMMTHGVIDPIWKSKRMHRGQVYLMLNKHFEKVIHVGESDMDQCKAIIQFIISSNI